MSTMVGIIGSGNIGAGVARMAVAAGLDVVLSNSRGPESLTDLVSELGALASADTVEGAAARADLIVLAVPISVYPHLPAKALEGKVVIDASNYVPQFTGVDPALDGLNMPTSEHVQAQWPAAKVVKALNNVDYVRLPQLPRPVGAPDRAALPLAGNDDDAKADVIAFLDRVGFDSVDLGPLANSWRSEPGTPLYVAPYSRERVPASDDPYTRFLEAEPVAVQLETVADLAAAATR